MPEIEILPNGVLDGAAGAFSAQTGKIYLSESVVNGEPALLRAVLLEEVGHYLDSVVNTQDATGDEGELFSALVRGMELSPWELGQIKAENDQAVLQINGEAVAVERSVITLTVNTEFDENDGSATGGAGLSLRDAIIIANNNINNDYIINLASGGTYFLTQSGTGNSGATDQLVFDLDIYNGANVTIRTNGATPATIRADTLLGTGDRVFQVQNGGILTLNQVVITGGFSDNGAGILVNGGGTLNLYQSTIRNNTASVNGGGIRNDGTTTIVQSTLNNNSAFGESTFFTTEGGGGIWNNGTLSVSNSTVSGNLTNGAGGGIDNFQGVVVLINTTITNNTADANNNQDVGFNGILLGGGIHNFSGFTQFALRNTLVAGNFNNPGVSGDLGGAIRGDANNLIGNLTGGSGTIGTGTDLVGVDAKLGPLANNGGLTQTHALLSGSAAINAGSTALIGTDINDSDGDGNTLEPFPQDQRGPGFVRVSGSSVDIGAFEVQATAPNPTITLAVSPVSVLEDGTANLVYTFTRTGSTTGALTVNYKIAGTAKATDYTGATPGTGKTITFAAGSSTATLTIDPTPDITVEPNETVILTLVAGTGYTIGTTGGVTGTITNDDSSNPGITLVGDNDDDFLLGGAGNDTLQGLGGNDVLMAAPAPILWKAARAMTPTSWTTAATLFPKPAGAASIPSMPASATPSPITSRI